MFNSKIKNLLVAMLGVSALVGAAGLIDQTQAAEQPRTKEEQPNKSDRERMVGNWFITNDDSLRKREMWVPARCPLLL